MPSFPSRLIAAVAAMTIAGAVPVVPSEDPPVAEWAIQAPLATASLLLDAHAVDGLIVAVGERGHIVRSDDDGKTWKQVPVPTRSMLTGVWFHDGKLGWAVGHDVVILKTVDGGASWRRVHFDPEQERPLLDVWFRDERRGFAVGAYGLFLSTNDGGETWETAQVSDDDYHLNDIASAGGGRLVMAAEAGLFYRSGDAGETWTSVPTGYAGSFFGVLPLGGESLLIFGLRGHLYRSDDGGLSWAAVPTETESGLTSGIVRKDGTVIVAGLAGTALVSRDGGRSFSVRQLPDRKGAAAVVETRSGTVLLFGEGGVRPLEFAE